MFKYTRELKALLKFLYPNYTYTTLAVDTNHKIVRGKCYHGGILDESRQELMGGVNSESYNYFLSPKPKFHNRSSQAAIKASQQFLFSGKQSETGGPNTNT